MSNLLADMSLLVRPATEADRPAIIDLLRRSLGESTIPKSEALWIWKHEHNPFGPSLVLVAEEGGMLCGVRAFMQWHFQRRGKIFRALRAVDTVTHPDHMGKGIFKKLTLQLVDTCKKEGYHFIFNTPNTQSKPGYIKMGWFEQGRMPVKFRFLRPLSIAISKFVSKKDKRGTYKQPPRQKWASGIFNLATRPVINEHRIATAITPDYISWRYAANPLFSYYHFSEGDNALLVARIKEHAFGRELRIADFILANASADARRVNALLGKSVMEFCSSNDIDFISMSGQQYQDNARYLRWMGMMPVLSAGPIVTLRNLNMKPDFTILAKKKFWGYSIGDLELF